MYSYSTSEAAAEDRKDAQIEKIHSKVTRVRRKRFGYVFIIYFPFSCIEIIIYLIVLLCTKKSFTFISIVIIFQLVNKKEIIILISMQLEKVRC